MDAGKKENKLVYVINVKHGQVTRKSLTSVSYLNRCPVVVAVVVAVVVVVVVVVVVGFVVFCSFVFCSISLLVKKAKTGGSLMANHNPKD